MDVGFRVPTDSVADEACGLFSPSIALLGMAGVWIPFSGSIRTGIERKGRDLLNSPALKEI